MANKAATEMRRLSRGALQIRRRVSRIHELGIYVGVIVKFGTPRCQRAKVEEVHEESGLLKLEGRDELLPATDVWGVET